MNISKEEIILAYKKLKSYAYYDNSSMVLRKQISEFEDENIDNKLVEILDKINNNDIE